MASYLEKVGDTASLKSHFDINLAKRGVYPLPGKYHLDFKSPGMNMVYKDLDPGTVQEVYAEAHKTLVESGFREPRAIRSQDTELRDYKLLAKKARSDKSVFKKLTGHEAAITFDTDDFYESPDYSVSYWINPKLGKTNALSHLTELTLTSWRLRDLSNYLEGRCRRDGTSRKDELRELIEETVETEYSRHLECRNDVAKKVLIEDDGRNLPADDREKLKAAVAKNDASITSARRKSATPALEKRRGYGRYATFFFGEKFLKDFKGEYDAKAVITDIEDAVSRHIDYETYRAVFSAGIRASVDGSGMLAEKLVNEALEYASVSQPVCDLHEKVYYSQLKVYGELLKNKAPDGNGGDNDNSVSIVKGKEVRHKGRKKNFHKAYVLDGKTGKRNELKNAWFEELSQVYLKNLESIDAIKSLDIGEDAIRFEYDSKKLAGLNGRDGGKAYKPPRFDTSSYDTLFDSSKDFTLKGSRTKAYDLYGVALSGAVLASGLGFLKTLPAVTHFVDPKLSLMDDDTVFFFAMGGTKIRSIIKHAYNRVTGKLYDYDERDLIAERWAHEVVDRDLGNKCMYELEKEERKYRHHGLVEINGAYENIKSLGLTAGTILALEGVGVIGALTAVTPALLAPVYGAAFWSAFSGIQDKLFLSPLRSVRDRITHRKELNEKKSKTDKSVQSVQ